MLSVPSPEVRVQVQQPCRRRSKFYRGWMCSLARWKMPLANWRP